MAARDRCIPKLTAEFLAAASTAASTRTVCAAFGPRLSCCRGAHRRHDPLESLSKQFGAVQALSDVSFEAQDGRITGLLGTMAPASRRRCVS